MPTFASLSLFDSLLHCTNHKKPLLEQSLFFQSLLSLIRSFSSFKLTTMKALYSPNFWRSNSHKDHQPLSGNCDTTQMPNTVISTNNEFAEGEDSFFELELTVPDFDNNQIISTSNKDNPSPDKDGNKFDFKEETIHNSGGNRKGNCAQPAVSLSPTDLLFKRKILPIEPIFKPQSPISFLKSSAPRFSVLMFKKSKSMSSHKIVKTGGTECNGVLVDTQKQESNRVTLKFKLEEAANGSVFTGDNRLRRQILEDPVSDEASKRDSKDGMQKFLKLIRYVTVSKKQSEKMNFSQGELSTSSSSSSPATTLPSGSQKKKKHGNISAGIRVVFKHLRKSKSSSELVGVSSQNVNRRDDSLLLQHDGIQSAILHCKKSFNSPGDSSLLSQFASDPLPARSMDSPRICKKENGIN